jgi:hypothetical protein
MNWLNFMKGVCLVAALGVTALLGAPDVARAATPEADALQQSDRSTNGAAFGSAIQQGLPADWAGSASGVLTKDPVLKLVHCCHGHPLYPYDSHCCHSSGGVVVVAPGYGYAAPRYGYGAAGVRGTARRTSRRTSRRVSRRR